MAEKVLMKGNEAIAEAAIIAGCRHYFGYPITPQTEIAAYMAKRMPKIGGCFLQAESEIAAINMVYGALQNRSRHAVLDVGGDDRGALAMGRYTPFLIEENDYEMLFVVNFFRPLTPEAKDALEVMAEVEQAAGLKCTAIVNNSNLAGFTSPEDVLKSNEKAMELSRISGLPIKMTGIEKSLFPTLEGKLENLFPMTLQKKYFDVKEI